MYRFLVVEDEAEEAAQLRAAVERYAGDKGLEGKVDWVKTAFELVELVGRYDLVFLDIDLPGISGMEAADLLRAYDEQTLIIFVTNLAQYAVRGYEVNALDFIVKPVTSRDLGMCLDRAVRVLRRRSHRSLYVPTKDGAKVFPLADLLYVEVQRHNIVYHLEGQDPQAVRGTLTKVAEDLGAGQFVRISNSCIVNADQVRAIEGPNVVMADGSTLAMSRARRKEALGAFADYYGGDR